MTILDWLTKSMIRLADAGVDSPRRDAFVLVEDLLKKDRSWVNAHAEFELSKEQILELDRKILRRIKREPLAYIRGKAWFYGRFFAVNPNVLIPRPESEAFIEIIKEMKANKIIEIGTGSGCLAITAKLELPAAEIIATDVDQNALSCAKINAKSHGAKIDFRLGNLLEPVENDLAGSTVMANLPYVPEDMITSKEIYREPKNALFSGKDGLDHYRKFFDQISTFSSKPDFILLESLEIQHEQVEQIAKNANYTIAKTSLLTQVFTPA